MNHIGLNISAMPPQVTPRIVLYFRFRHEIGEAIRQVEYDLLQTNLSQHRGYDDSADALCHDGYWAVVATSEAGIGADAVEYTKNYLLSMPVVEDYSITTTPALPQEA